jgi:hypothetical protein
MAIARRTPHAACPLALAFGVTLAVSTACPRSARAQASAADAQFDFGLAEMQAGRYETGCPALGDSYRLDPKPGSLFTLAECEWRWGKSIAALTHYEAYLDLFSRMTAEQQSRQHGRDKLAEAKRDELRARVPRLALAFARPPPKGTTVKRDGVPLGPAAVGAEVPLEAGEHRIEILVPGQPPRIARVVLAAGEARRLVIDMPDGEPDANAPPADPPPPAAPESADSPWTAITRAPPLRMGAFVAGGVAVLGLGIGTAFGVVTLGHKSTLDDHCRGFVCDAEGKAAADDAHSSATISTVAFTIGVAGVATAITLWLLDRDSATSPARVKPSATLGPGQASLGATVAF